MTTRRIQQQQLLRWACLCIALLVNSVVGVGASSHDYEWGHQRHRTNPSGAGAGPDTTPLPPPPPLPPGGREYAAAYQTHDYQQQQQQQQLYNSNAAADPRSDSQPQLQPSSSRQSQGEPYTPIHYSFKKEAPPSNRKKEVLTHADELPLTALPLDETIDKDYTNNNNNNYNERVAEVPSLASPRQDAITVYMSTAKGALAIRSSCVLVGYGIGGIVGKVRRIHIHCFLL
jgi:hypothetical protein